MPGCGASNHARPPLSQETVEGPLLEEALCAACIGTAAGGARVPVTPGTKYQAVQGELPQVDLAGRKAEAPEGIVLAAGALGWVRYASPRCLHTEARAPAEHSPGAAAEGRHAPSAGARHGRRGCHARLAGDLRQRHAIHLLALPPGPEERGPAVPKRGHENPRAEHEHCDARAVLHARLLGVLQVELVVQALEGGLEGPPDELLAPEPPVEAQQP
mmetsp:Transcript_95648/g.297773  ORF Transcript_95648/g.297773 Transcript_95648/m.297773 type:complete len:216 (+) Transcript_95648:690-1337(+)